MAVKNWNDQLTIAFLSALILGAGWIVSASPEKVQMLGFSLPTLCPFKLLTTWDCPGCGLTRSLVLALHGSWKASYATHIWGMPLMLLLLFQIPYRTYRYFRQRPISWRTPAGLQKWITPTIFLSILLPWIVKTLWLAAIRYL
jgi:hypothetical protein